MKTNLCSFLCLIGGAVHVKSVDPYGICMWQTWMYRAYYYYYYYYWKMDQLLFSAWLVVQKKNDNNKNNNNFISLNVLRSCFESLLLCFSPIILNWGRGTNHCQSPNLWPRTCIFFKVVAENSFAQIIIYQRINEQRPSGVSNNDSE